MSSRDGNRINKTEFWDDRELSGEDAALSRRMDEFFRAEMDITEVKSDPGYAETDKAAKLMITDYQENMRNTDNEKYIRDSLSGNKGEERIKDEIREIREEIKSKGLEEISSEWVREWHKKKQANGSGTIEIKEYITSSFEEGEKRSQNKPNQIRKTALTRALIIKYISASAAVLAGVIFAVNALIPSNDTGKLFEKYYESITAVSPVTRSMNGNVTGMWSSAVNSYNKGDYNTALAGFSGLMSMDTSLVPPRFFLGMTHLALGNYNQALNILKCVADMQGEYSKEARWYLGLAYLKEGDKSKASDCFRYLLQSSDYYSERAEKILRRLE
jgi:TolA-binding protein